VAQRFLNIDYICRMMNSSTMSDMLRDMMQQRGEKANEPEFVMPGDMASPVMYEAETGRAYVIYEDEQGNRNKIFGDWESYIVGSDDMGNDMIAPEEYPISRDDSGDFVLDEQALEEMIESEMQAEQMEEEQSMEGEGAMMQRGGGQEEGFETPMAFI
jgi:hypothetical protein